MKRFLVHVRLLFVAVSENPVRKQLDYYERIAETVRIQRDYITGVQNLQNESKSSILSKRS